ncbi:CTP synthase [bacterium BMS3Bbin04]|nr:CTP synthase [bacterium BMS3Bbin04]
MAVKHGTVGRKRPRIPRAKYIFVTGGVVSSLGKGITSASLGLLLKARGYRVTIMKADPYLNVDPGTMSPFQHGEVYVTDDGAETDLDLGHYERFIDESMGKLNNVTSGQIYERVIQKERNGDYLGGTVQVIPHVTNEIIDSICDLARSPEKPQFIIVEVGGTVGDIESLPFLEAFRQFYLYAGSKNVCFIHVTLLPYIAAADEVKTKPTQHSVYRLREIGLQPNIIVARTEKPIGREQREKIALFCNVHTKDVMAARDAKSIYEVPLNLAKEGLATNVLKKLGMALREPDLDQWRERVERILHPSKTVKIAVVGKYVGLQDAYKSIGEAFIHTGSEHDCDVQVKWVDAEEVEKKGGDEMLKDFTGILIPGGFGIRGSEGKIEAARYARENNIPFFGICLGLQMAVAEFARNVAGLKNANSTEFKPRTRHPVIALMPGQRALTQKGGTMRLGSWACHLKRKTKAFDAYGKELIYERHRHRYEFNNKYKEPLTKAGMIFSGVNPDEGLVEMIELPDHPWFVGCQFHPELKSRLTNPHPLFLNFVGAALDEKKRREKI